MFKFIVFILMLELITSSNSLQCYTCMTSGGKKCDGKSEMETRECGGMNDSGLMNGKAVCLKVVKEIKGFDHITRSCGFEGTVFNACKAFESAEFCGICESNLCNSGRRNMLSIFTIFTFCVTHFMFMRCSLLTL